MVKVGKADIKIMDYRGNGKIQHLIVCLTVVVQIFFDWIDCGSAYI